MNVISPLIQFQQQLRIFHWQTDSYAAHEAFGEAYKNLDDLVDTFVEEYMGRFGRSKPTTTFAIELKPLVNMELVDSVLFNFIQYLEDMDKQIRTETNLLNIRDEMKSLVRKLQYLLTLK
jgi:DNA-binding ferritin-like protein